MEGTLALVHYLGGGSTTTYRLYSSASTYSTLSNVAYSMFSFAFSLGARLVAALRVYLAYRESGAEGVREAVRDLVLSALGRLYRDLGVEWDGEVCFARLADVGAIDEKTALYLTTLYLSIEELLDELEEGEGGAGEVLRRIAEELGELMDVLAQVYCPSEAQSFVLGQTQET